MKFSTTYIFPYFLSLIFFLFTTVSVFASGDIGSVKQNNQTINQETISYTQNPSNQNNIIIPVNHNLHFHSVLKGMGGIFFLLLLGFLFSKDRRHIPWRTVSIGLSLQIIFAILLLYVPFISNCIEYIGLFFVKILDFAKAGSKFVFGSLADSDKFGYIFAFQLLPAIIFFSALTSLLFYWKIIQKIVKILGWMFSRLMIISGAEALSVAGNIFVGMIESPIMIKEYLPKMNSSEIMLVMTGGLSTIAGGVLAAYIGLLGGNDPVLRLEFARYLITASVMAAPGAILFSKMIIPNPDAVNSKLSIKNTSIDSNSIEAITNGTIQGIKMAATIAGMLIVFLALINMLNFCLIKFGVWTGLNDIISESTDGKYTECSIQLILGYIFAPFMWILGICKHDITLVGQLLGEKIIFNEFVGYIHFAELKTAGAFLESKSIIMTTYILCGFANFGSVGILIGGIGSLAHNQKATAARYGFIALVAGTLTALMSATIIGMFQ